MLSQKQKENINNINKKCNEFIINKLDYVISLMHKTNTFEIFKKECDKPIINNYSNKKLIDIAKEELYNHCGQLIKYGYYDDAKNVIDALQVLSDYYYYFLEFENQLKECF